MASSDAASGNPYDREIDKLMDEFLTAEDPQGIAIRRPVDKGKKRNKVLNDGDQTRNGSTEISMLGDSRASLVEFDKKKVRTQKRRRDALTLLRLKFACAIIANDPATFKAAQGEVSKKGFGELDWIISYELSDLREGMGSNGRHLMVQSLAAAIADNDEQAV